MNEEIRKEQERVKQVLDEYFASPRFLKEGPEDNIPSDGIPDLPLHADPADYDRDFNMDWREYNDADGCDWQDTGFYPTDLNGCI